MRAVMSKCVNEDLKHVMPKIKASTLLMWGKMILQHLFLMQKPWNVLSLTLGLWLSLIAAIIVFLIIQLGLGRDCRIFKKGA